MSLVINSKTYSRLWASIMSDFEKILNKFLFMGYVSSKCFSKLVKDMEFVMIFQCSQGKGQTRKEQYEKTAFLIIQIAKELWLEIPSEIEEIERKFGNALLKRSICGLYLTYLLWEKQPLGSYGQKIKIPMDVDDYFKLNSFFQLFDEAKANMLHPEVANDVYFILYSMHLKSAFEPTTLPDPCSLEPFTRSLKNRMKAKTSIILRNLKLNSDFEFYNFHKFKFQLEWNKLLGFFRANKYIYENTISEKDVIRDEDGENYTGFSGKFKESRLKEIEKQVYYGTCKRFNRPILSSEYLLANEDIERIKKMKAKKLLEQVAKKKQKAIREGTNANETMANESQFAINPYIRIDGIYGRKKGKDKETRKSPKAGSICSQNLWNFIHNTPPTETEIENNLN